MSKADLEALQHELSNLPAVEAPSAPLPPPSLPDGATEEVKAMYARAVQLHADMAKQMDKYNDMR